jgi:N6-L-threonylcarbamoyladenine synthase
LNYSTNKNINKKGIYILGIETSCDDTCAAVVRDGSEILSNIVSSQDDIHRKYGGIVPEIASRKHIEVIDIVIKEALERSGVGLENIDAVSVTNRPGLIGSLLVGVGAAKAICYAKKRPLIAANHLEAHIYSNLLEDHGVKGGFIALIVSGGHTSLYFVDYNWNIKEIGHTVDDAAGEAFDKIARYLGLIYRTKKEPKLLAGKNLSGLAASFQKSVVDVLTEKTIGACRRFKVSKVLVSGGVAANSRLREELKRKARTNDIKVFIPPVNLCTDNAAMVACLGYYKYLKKDFDDLEVDVYSRSGM